MSDSTVCVHCGEPIERSPDEPKWRSVPWRHVATKIGQCFRPPVAEPVPVETPANCKPIPDLLGVGGDHASPLGETPAVYNSVEVSSEDGRYVAVMDINDPDNPISVPNIGLHTFRQSSPFYESQEDVESAARVILDRVAGEPVKATAPEPVHGALARAEALAAGDSEWMNRTTWPPERKKSEPEFQSEGDSDIPPDTREAAWLVWAGGSPNRYGSVLRDGFLAGWDAAVKATAERILAIIATERATYLENEEGWPTSTLDVVSAAIRAEYENGDQ